MGQSPRLDAVFSYYRSMVYQGTPEAVRNWIGSHDPEKLNKYYKVTVGETGEELTIAQYLGWDEITEDIK